MVKLFLRNLWIVCLFAVVGLQAQTTISGTVMDAEYNEPLIGANVLIVGTTTGTSTDLDGNFSLTSSEPLPWNLEVSYTGFETQNITVSGPTSNLRIDLGSSSVLTDEVVISASRRREKIQEAPASISVLTARKLEASPQDNPVRNLINEPGVNIMQQSAGVMNIQLRGDGGLFGSASFPILDYRALSGPGLGTFDALNSPINNLDISRIEVVRGPGSALYGPGVTSGVIHFISKSPIDEPCTSFELTGGELNTFGGAFRHATKVSDKFGFKINGLFKRGDEFTLDPVEDAAQIARFRRQVVAPAISGGVVDPTGTPRQLLSESDLDPDGDGNMMQDFWDQKHLTATLEFRPQDDLSINLSGGWNNASHVFYNSQGEGLSQANEYWTQARVQKGGLFAQVYWLNNDGGTDDNPTFLYQTGSSTRVQRTQLEAQAQYNFDTPSLLDANWTAGFDFRQSINNTFNQVYGRNEDDDDYSIVGAYLQGKFALGKKLDLVLAGRGDKFNFLDDVTFSPRVAMVFKPAPTHTFRASYNRAIGAPTQLQVNIDFPVSTIVPGAYDVWLVGNKNEQTFSNPEIVFNGALPFPNLPVGTPGLPLGFVQGALDGALRDQVFPAVRAGIVAANPAAEALIPLIAPAVEEWLLNPANYAQGFGGGPFVGINLFNQQPLGIVNAPQFEPRIEDTWEFGYKGLIGGKVGLAVDLYNKTIDGSTLFTAISPSYGLPGYQGISDDLSAAVATNLTPFLVEQLTPFAPLLPASVEEVAAQVAGAYAFGYAQAGDGFEGQIAPLAAGFVLASTPTDNVPNNGVTHVAAGYRTFDKISYTGLDAALEYYVNDELSLFSTYSWISDNVFQADIKGSDGSERTTLSVPLWKFRVGANYLPEYGFRANASFQHEPSYEVFIGQFSGDTDVKNLVDAAIGYKFNNGLSIDVTAQNLFDNEYRAFPNFPKIGRRVLGKLTYHLCGAKADADGDGIADEKDMCPNTPGLKDFGGCPDSDGDGIKDNEDACPLAAGSRDLMGCPDADGDGVADKDDLCPQNAGTLNGCPDGDGDGVADKDDACPTVAGNLGGCPDADGDGVRDQDDNCPSVAGTVGGCPDSDGDGFIDKDDACPNTPGTDGGCPSDPDSDGDGFVDSKDGCPNTPGTLGGCPDGDKDGVADANDKCPTLGGNVNPDGCPVVPERVTTLFTRALQGIQFETSSNRIRSSSRSILNEVVQVMRENPSYKLTVAGHTDSVGSSSSNQTLSQRRADAVKKYLTDAGIPSSSIVSVGYGEDRPVADNKTNAGRRQNRRVELSVDYLR